MTLTGRTRYRTSWRGKLILQVEEAWVEHEDLGGSGHFDRHDRTGWRDARAEDLLRSDRSLLNGCPQVADGS